LSYNRLKELNIMKQFDERDTMFSRRGLIKGTKKYNAYYKRHPELQTDDDRVRESTKNMMAKIFGVELDSLMITQKIMRLINRRSLSVRSKWNGPFSARISSGACS